MTNHRELMELMERYSRAVGIDRMLPGEPDGRVWAGRYAQIALCMVADCSIEAIMNAKERWQLKLDELLVKQEQANLTVIDGYLILVLPQNPDDRLRPYIREVEMDTFICRKHVIWPEDAEKAEEKWQRIFNVTVLGLPPSPKLCGGAKMPALSGAQRTIWKDIRRMGPGPAAARLLAKG